jgi:hypothetical protein
LLNLFTMSCYANDARISESLRIHTCVYRVLYDLFRKTNPIAIAALTGFAVFLSVVGIFLSLFISFYKRKHHTLPFDGLSDGFQMILVTIITVVYFLTA